MGDARQNDTENSMLNIEEITNTIHAIKRTQEKYGEALKTKGVDAVVKEFENYLWAQLDIKLAANELEKQVARAFRGLGTAHTPINGAKVEAYDKLYNYRTALRAILDGTSKDSHFESVLHNSQEIYTVGYEPEQLSIPLREMMALYWLAVTDPNMEITEDNLKTQTIAQILIASKEIFIDKIAEIRRAHNDSLDSTVSDYMAAPTDQLSCLPGTFGRLAHSAPYNSIASIVCNIDKYFPQEAVYFIMQKFKELPKSDQLDIGSYVKAKYNDLDNDDDLTQTFGETLIGIKEKLQQFANKFTSIPGDINFTAEFIAQLENNYSKGAINEPRRNSAENELKNAMFPELSGKLITSICQRESELRNIALLSQDKEIIKLCEESYKPLQDELTTLRKKLAKAKALLPEQLDLLYCEVVNSSEELFTKFDTVAEFILNLGKTKLYAGLTNDGFSDYKPALPEIILLEFSCVREFAEAKYGIDKDFENSQYIFAKQCENIEVLKYIVQITTDRTVLLEIAKNINTDASTLFRVACCSNADADTLSWIAGHPKADADTLSSVAEHPNTNVEILSVVATHPNADVETLYLVAENLKADADTLYCVAQHPNTDADTLSLVAHNPKADVETLHWVEKHPNTDIDTKTKLVALIESATLQQDAVMPDVIPKHRTFFYQFNNRSESDDYNDDSESDDSPAKRPRLDI